VRCLMSRFVGLSLRGSGFGDLVLRSERLRVVEQQQQRHIAVRSDDESEDESEASMGSSTKRHRETQGDPVFGRAERPKLSHHSLLIAAAALEQQSAGGGGGGEEEEVEEGFFLQQKSPRLQLDKNSKDLKLGQQQRQRHSTSPPEDKSSRLLFSEEERQQHKPSSAAADVQVAAEGSKISITAAAAAKDPFQLTPDQKVKLLLHVCPCTHTPKLQENTRNRRRNVQIICFFLTTTCHKKKMLIGQKNGCMHGMAPLTPLIACHVTAKEEKGLRNMWNLYQL
jgi:hypothetical protein